MAYVNSPNSAMLGSRALEKLFDRAFERRAKLIVEKIKVVWVKAVQDIIDHSPVYTGASAGDLNGPFKHRLNYKSHPVKRLDLMVGNAFDGEPGYSGWTIHENKINQYKTQFYVTNAMWDFYLKKVEKAGRSGGNFVREAMNRLRERLRSGDI